MTVSSNTSRVKYTCSGDSSFDFTFGIGETSEIQVIKTIIATGAETTLTETTDYTVSATNDDYSSGGTVTTVEACATGYSLTILRDVPLTQESDFTEGSPTLYESFEDGLDKLTRITQQQQEEINRAPKVAQSSSITDIALPNPTASNYIGWNAAATGLENKSGPVITTATQYEVDALVSYGGGTAYTQATIEAALTAIGTTNKVTLLLRPGTWVISSNADWSAYTNVTFKIVPGAVISHGAFTVNIPNRIMESTPFQWLTGTGAVTFSGNVRKAYPSEFTTNTIPGTTDMTLAIGYAAAAISGVSGSVIMDSSYGISSAIVMKSNVTYRGKGTLKVISASAFSILDDGNADLSNVTIDGLTFDGSLNYSAGMIAGTVNKNTVAIYNNGVYVSRATGATTQVSNFTVKNCKFYYISGDAVLFYADNMADIQVTDNYFYYGSYTGRLINISNPGGAEANQAKRVTISRNHSTINGPQIFYDPTEVKWISSADGIVVNMVQDSTISNNTIDHAGSIGIRVEDSYRVAVTGNTVTESGSEGITIYKANVGITVTGNTVKNWGRTPPASSIRSYGGKYYIAREAPHLTLATLPANPSTSQWFQEWPYPTTDIDTASIIAYDDSDYTLEAFRGNAAISTTNNLTSGAITGNIAIGYGSATYASDYGYSTVHLVNTPSSWVADTTVVGNNFRGANIADIYRPNCWDPINARGVMAIAPKIFNNIYRTSYAGAPTATYTSDFSAGADSWTAGQGTVTGNIDTIGGLDDWLRLTVDNTAATHYALCETALVIGKRYRVQFTYYIPSTNSNVDGLKFTNTGNLVTGLTVKSATDASTTAYEDFTATTEQLRLNATDGDVLIFTDAGGDDVIYVRGITVVVLGTNVDLYNYPVAADNAAAAAAGVPIGGLYRTNADPSVINVRTL